MRTATLIVVHQRDRVAERGRVMGHRVVGQRQHPERTSVCVSLPTEIPLSRPAEEEWRRLGRHGAFGNGPYTNVGGHGCYMNNVALWWTLGSNSHMTHKRTQSTAPQRHDPTRDYEHGHPTAMWREYESRRQGRRRPADVPQDAMVTRRHPQPTGRRGGLRPPQHPHVRMLAPGRRSLAWMGGATPGTLEAPPRAPRHMRLSGWASLGGGAI